eukprot:TRINITY_DN3947_c0_g1_i1.p1 TRINITY_DN3947_c0_g1~~TRINITY_DN3947_c0_g1_i1.p1  ORF type:complete len:471 (+),score=85.27 TRINITY_DN3947_c0_g1_i1:606-2018(+)
MAPLTYHTLEYASPFSSEQCPEGVISISSNVLRIFSVQKLGDMFNQADIPLTLTPRRFIVEPSTNHLVVLETDQNAEFPALSGEKDGEDMDLDETKVDFSASEEYKLYGGAKPGEGHWASCIRLLSVDGHTLDLLQLTNNEVGVSLCTCVFHEKSSEVLLCVGTAKDLRFNPRTASGGFIHIYRLVENKEFQLVHKTAIDGVPQALCAFQGQLLVGVNNALRVYDYGKKKLLRRCETRTFPSYVHNIQTHGDRIMVTDVQEAIHYVKYKRTENRLFIYADNPTPRWYTTFIPIDYDTTCAADKFGTIFFSRVPAMASEESQEDPTGMKLRLEAGYLNAAPNKLQDVAIFHVGETIHSLQKTSLVPGGAEIVFYTTLMGTMGAMLPFVSREDVDFFTHLEMHMRAENPPLCGRDHLAFRSNYYPCKNVIDGDLCEQYSSIDPAKQKIIAEELDRTPMEVLKKLEDIRNRLL